MRTLHSSLFVLCLILGCGSSASEAPEPEAASGSEAAPEDGEAEGGEPAPQEAPAEPEASAEPDVMQELQGKVIQLGVNRAALERTLEGPQIDCKRAESQRDRICSLTDEICAGAAKDAQAQPQCDNAKTKCDKAKADVKEVRCR